MMLQTIAQLVSLFEICVRLSAEWCVKSGAVLEWPVLSRYMQMCMLHRYMTLGQEV
jgi:hypothetical protein